MMFKKKTEELAARGNNITHEKLKCENHDKSQNWISETNASTEFIHK